MISIVVSPLSASVVAGAAWCPGRYERGNSIRMGQEVAQQPMGILTLLQRSFDRPRTPEPSPPTPPVAHAIGADAPPYDAQDFYNGFVKRSERPEPRLSAEDRELTRRRAVKWGRR
jgi:hypothetical protein